MSSIRSNHIVGLGAHPAYDWPRLTLVIRVMANVTISKYNATQMTQFSHLQLPLTLSCVALRSKTFRDETRVRYANANNIRQ